MTKALNVPDEFENSFQHLIYSLPEILRNDERIQKIILVYLKLGGEKLARHGVEIIKMRLREEILKKSYEEPDVEESESDEPNSEEDDSLEFPA